MIGEFIAWLPRDLSLWHLQRTWLYWLLVAFLIAEALYFQPRSLSYLRQRATASEPQSGPWGTSASPATKVTIAIALTSILTITTIAALLVGSNLAFYAVLLGVIPAALRLTDALPRADTGETIGAAIGAFIGVAVQILLVLSAISSIDPTSEFPLRLSQHLDQKAAQ